MQKKLFRYLLGALAIVSGTFAQIPSTTHVSYSSALPISPFGEGQVPEMQRILNDLDVTRLQPVVAKSWEAQILEAGTQAAGVVLDVYLDPLKADGLYTLDDERGDTLVAHWNGGRVGRPEKAIWLWDTPFYTTIILELDPHTIDGDSILQYCEHLFAWDKFQVFSPVKSVKLQRVRSGGNRSVTSIIEHRNTATGSYDVWLAALTDSIASHLAVAISKAIVYDKYPPDADRVPERFPPLRSRLKNFSRAALFTELGKGYDGSIASYPARRDAILLDELAARGPIADDEVKRIVFLNPEKNDYGNAQVVNERMNNLVQALTKSGQFARYAPTLTRILFQAPQQSLILAEHHVVGAMHSEHIDFSSDAINLLEQGRFVADALWYLRSDASDARVLRRLEQIAVEPQFQQDKSNAVSAIRRRLPSEHY
ncbi:MAG TPA: hypothetical protein VKU01_20785 [Bryobacteraceae bacterium]|nr:hypothetical protein [Bryobacteraceae bacterium]